MTRDEFLAAVACGESGVFKVEDPATGRTRLITVEAHDAEVLKAYIAQPMKDKEPDDIITERDLAVEHLSQLYPDKEIEVIDTYDQEGFDESAVKNKPVWFLGRNIKKLSEADVVYFVDGWREARGCTLEHLVAENYGIEIAYDGGTDAVTEDDSVTEESSEVETPTVPPLV